MFMLATLALVALTLRAGLALRRARRLGLPRSRAMLRRHLRLARPAVWLVAAGFAAGPLSALWLRGWEPFRTAHALAAGVTLVLFAIVGWLGRRLERGHRHVAGLHGLLAVAAALAAAAALGSGLVLLP